MAKADWMRLHPPMLSTVVIRPLDELEPQPNGDDPMKLRTRLLCYTAAIALSSGAAFAAIDGNQLADDYLAKGYDFVEVKVGPTQTKVEAIKDGVKVEVIYDNETFEIIKQESESADADDAARTGKEVKTVGKDFEDRDDNDDNDDEDDDNDDDDDDDDGGDDDSDDGDDSDDDDDDDNSGSGGNSGSGSDKDDDKD
jgi:hypothetical protein